MNTAAILLIRSFNSRSVHAGLVVLSILGCNEQPSDDTVRLSSIRDAAFTDVFAVEDTIVLEENADIITVTPNVEIDGDSLYLIADERERQMRVYSPTGAVSAYFGRKGKGPGEFTAPTKMIRSTSGALLVADISSRISTYSANGDSLIGTLETPFTRIYDIDLVDNSTLLVSGILSKVPNKRLHLFSLRDTAVLRSFLTAPAAIPAPLLDAAGFAVSVVNNDTIYATLSLVDSIYRFSRNGERYAPISVSGIRFRPFPSTLPAANAGPRERADWYGSFSLLSRVVPLTNGFLLIYQDRRDMLPVWHLAILDHSGAALANMSEAPEYVGAFSDGRFAFVQPGSETPNRWTIVRLTDQFRDAVQK